MLGQSKQTIQAWEAGRHHPMPTAFPDISAKTGIPMHELYGAPPIDLGAATDAALETAPPWARQLVTRLSSVEREIRQLRLDLLKTTSPAATRRSRAVERFVGRMQTDVTPGEREFLSEMAEGLLRLRVRLLAEEGLDAGKSTGAEG